MVMRVLRTAVGAALLVGSPMLASCTGASSPPPTGPAHHSIHYSIYRSSARTQRPKIPFAAACRAGHARSAGRTVVFRGAKTHRHYCSVIWKSDVIHNCAQHAYGTTMIAFLKQHPCGSARRVLATVYLRHGPVDISSIATSFAGTANNPFGAELDFTNLEKARRTRGLKDLLREGDRMPGPHAYGPAHAMFGVYALNVNINIIRAWYPDRPTATHDQQLALLERDLAFSTLTG
jgi:hypothetical protein